MAMFHIVGSNLVEPGEYDEKIKNGEIDELYSAVNEEKNFEIDFQNGTTKSADIAEETKTGVVPYQPIGIGRPMSVEIMTIYTGDFIKGLFAGKKRDLLCVSGVKPNHKIDAVSKAVNIVDKGVREKTYLEFSALKTGTPFIYYTKAVDTDALLVSIELDGKSFNESIFNTLSGLMKKAAGLPVFMPAAGYLLGGSELLRLAANAGKELFESQPFIKETLPINFATAGLPTNISRSFLLCQDTYKQELSRYKIDYIDDGGIYKMRLVQNNNVYNGDAPYIIVNIDGAEKSALESFAPTFASSILLSKFYGSDDTLQSAGNILQEAMQLFNDFTYRRKADDLEKELKMAVSSGDTTKYAAKKVLLDAYLKNIQNDLLKKASS